LLFLAFTLGAAFRFQVGFKRETLKAALQRVEVLEIVRLKDEAALFLLEHDGASFTEAVSLSEAGGNDDLTL